jgi:hypothetical protein
MKDSMIISNGCVTPKDWTVNTNARHDYTLTANTVYQDWLDSQSK